MIKQIFAALIVFALFTSASAQQSVATEKAPVESKAEQELKKKADTLLFELVQKVRELKNRDNQINARIVIADLLWKDHQAKARGLYREAFDLLSQSSEVENEDIPEELESSQISQWKTRLLDSLSSHDPLMARDLLRETRQPVQSQTESEEVPRAAHEKSAETRVEMSVATEMVNQDPKEALRIARLVLDEGYPYELMELLPKLAEKEPQATKEFVVAMMSKLRKADFASDYEAAGLAVALVTDAIASALVDPKEEGAEKRTPILDPQTAREFVEFLTNAALKKQSGTYGNPLLMSLNSIVDGLEKFAPAQAALLKQKFLDMEKESGREVDPYARFHQASQTTDLKALLELAGTAPREVRDSLYGQAATLAWSQGDKAKANEILRTKIPSSLERNRLLSEFHRSELDDLTERGAFVEARQLIQQVRPPHDRAQQLINLAAAIATKGDKKLAFEILQEVHALVSGKARKVKELELQLRLAGALAEFDADGSFALVDSAIEQINELMTAATLIANFENFQSTIKDDEFSMDSSPASRYGFSALSSKDIRQLAQVDFARTMETFSRFRRPELRLSAYLSLAKSIIEPQPTIDDCTCQERLKKMRGQAANSTEQAPR